MGELDYHMDVLDVQRGPLSQGVREELCAAKQHVEELPLELKKKVDSLTRRGGYSPLLCGGYMKKNQRTR